MQNKSTKQKKQKDQLLEIGKQYFKDLIGL